MSGRPWTPAELEELKARYPHEQTRALAKHFGRTVGSIYAQVQKLDLYKTEECKRQFGGRQNLEKGVGNRFKPGHTSWNKGRRYNAGGRSHETRFGPGHKPNQTLPIGTVVKSHEGYWKRKVSENAPPGMSRRNWVWVHRELWEQHHGPVPQGYSVVFRNGNVDDIRIENLELVHRREVMKRNSVHNLPEELRTVIQLNGALKRKINRRTEREEQTRRPEESPVRDA